MWGAINGEVVHEWNKTVGVPHYHHTKTSVIESAVNLRWRAASHLGDTHLSASVGACANLLLVVLQRVLIPRWGASPRLVASPSSEWNHFVSKPHPHHTCANREEVFLLQWVHDVKGRAPGSVNSIYTSFSYSTKLGFVAVDTAEHRNVFSEKM